MTFEEYKNRRSLIRKKADSEICELANIYAMERKRANVGDIISCLDGNTKMLVERIFAKIGLTGEPYVVYSGQAVNKSLEPYKKVRRYSITDNYLGRVVKAAGAD